jgi:hypothetical protein
MMVETFYSEISLEDLEDQISKFLLDNNFRQIEKRLTSCISSGHVDYVAQVMYEEDYCLHEIVEEIERNFKYQN